MKRILGIASAIAVFVAVPVRAAPVVYTIDGTFDGTLEGRDFSGRALRFVGRGDTDDVVRGAGVAIGGLSSWSVVDGARTLNFNFGNAIAFADDGGIVPIHYDAGGFMALSLPFAYSGRESLSATAARFDGGTTLPFDGQDFTGLAIRTGSDLRFRAAIGAVPEPAAWALMIGGFGMAGAALRHRPRATIRTA